MKLAKLIALIAAVPMLFACRQLPMGTATYIKVNGPTEFHFPGNGGEETLAIETDGKTINVISSEKWCKAVYVPYKEQLNIKVSKTTVMKEREATVTLSYRGAKDVVITISQDASEVELDPYTPEKYYMPWDDKWTVEGFIYANKQYGDKYEPMMWGENGLPKFDSQGDGGNPFIWNEVACPEKITVGVKLEKPMLEYFKGKRITYMEADVTGTSVKFAVVKVAKSASAAPVWAGDFVDQAEVLWSADAIIPAQGWPHAEVSGVFLPDETPEESDIMCVAYIEGKANEIIWSVPQHVSKFAPNYLSIKGNEGKEMFLFTGGSLPFNLYFAD